MAMPATTMTTTQWTAISEIHRFNVRPPFCYACSILVTRS